MAKRKHHHLVELGLAMMLHALHLNVFWLKNFSLLLSLLTDCPLPLMTCTHLTFFFIRKSLLMIFFIFFVVSVFHIFVPMPRIKLSPSHYHVFLLATVTNTKGIVASTYLMVKFILLAMLCLMRTLFPLPHVHVY